jgi:uncharacterized cupin superfamily protein
MTTTMTQYLGNAATVSIELVSKDGSPKVEGLFPFPDIGGAQVGVWEVEPAEWSSVGNEEVFVVLSGKGTVEFLKTGEIVDLLPGAIVKLNKGDASEWKITEQLRKVYIIDPNA